MSAYRDQRWKVLMHRIGYLTADQKAALQERIVNEIGPEIGNAAEALATLDRLFTEAVKSAR